MFNSFQLSKIEFTSNPDLGEDYKVELSTNDYGSPVNRIVRVPRSNRPFYDGVKYDPALMSLRAKLNSGIDLQRVSFGQTENDPNKLFGYALHFEQSLAERYDQARKASADSVSEAASVQTPAPAE